MQACAKRLMEHSLGNWAGSRLIRMAGAPRRLHVRPSGASASIYAAPWRPSARYHVQDREVAFATGRSMCHDEKAIPLSCRLQIVRVFSSKARCKAALASYCSVMSITVPTNSRISPDAQPQLRASWTCRVRTGSFPIILAHQRSGPRLFSSPSERVPRYALHGAPLARPW